MLILLGENEGGVIRTSTKGEKDMGPAFTSLSRLLCSFAIVCMLTGAAGGMNVTEQKIVSPNPADSGNFGLRIISDGSVLVVGEGYDNTGTRDIPLYLHSKNPDGNWLNDQILPGYNNVDLDGEIAMDGDWLFAENGDVFVYKKSANGQYSYYQTISQFSLSGYGPISSVAVSGSYAAMGIPSEPRNGNTSSGAVHTFVFNLNTQLWEKQATVLYGNPSHYQNFGSRVEMEGEYLYVSSPKDPGKIFIYWLNNDSWQYAHEVDPGCDSSDCWGFATWDFDVNGTDLLVGMHGPDSSEPNWGLGGARLYRKNLNNFWEPAAILSDTDVDSFIAYFGEAVAIGNDGRMYVGCPGLSTVYIFKDNGTLYWDIEKKLVPADADHQASDHFGKPIAIIGDEVAVSAPYFTDSASGLNNTGAVFLFTFSEAVKGDINGDEDVTLEDVILGLQVAAGNLPDGINADGDVNDDRQVGIEEVIYDLQELSKP